jgi:ribosomal protein S18 acetylase RimI-like enzyme
VSDAVTITVGSDDEIPHLREPFLALHQHHRELTPIALTEPDDRAWAARAATYAQHFADGRGLLHIAWADDRCVGYAFTVFHDGDDDTFPLSGGYGELYTLAVLPECRGAGIGGRRLDLVDDALDVRGVDTLSVAVMAANDAAIRLYQRRGLVPVELVMYRRRSPGS